MISKTTSYFLLLVAVVCLYTPVFCETLAQRPDGEGTASNPFLISNLANLRWLSETPAYWGHFDRNSDGSHIYIRHHYVQTSNIDAYETRYWNNGKGLRTIGRFSNITALEHQADFFSHYDGANYTIQNLYINTPENDHGIAQLGLFGVISGSVIQNVRLRNIEYVLDPHNDDCSTTSVGGLVGRAVGSEIVNSSVTGSLHVLSHYHEHDSPLEIGGLVGWSIRSIVERCYSTVKIHNGSGHSNNLAIGGLIGTMHGGVLENSYFKGHINNYAQTFLSGGLVGAVFQNQNNPVLLRYCYVAGVEFVNTHFLIGSLRGAVVSNCLWDETTTGITTVYGIIGDPPSLINGAHGLPSSSMTSRFVYVGTGWNFYSIWGIDPNINDGYPYIMSNPHYTDSHIEVNTMTTGLLGNYPNPFNPVTTIKFTLQNGGLVNIDIFNVKGQRVKALLSEFKPAGVYREIWDGTDDMGRYAGSGVYFYQMSVGNHVETKKMLLMK